MDLFVSVRKNKFLGRFFESTLLNCSLSVSSEAKPIEVSIKPFQRLVGAAAIGGRASQGAKHLFRRFSFVSFSFAPAVSKEKRNAIQNVFK